MRQVTERDFRLPEFADAKVEDYEFRADGKLVRKDRWEQGMLKVASALGFSVRDFEIGAVISVACDIRHTLSVVCERLGIEMPEVDMHNVDSTNTFNGIIVALDAKVPAKDTPDVYVATGTLEADESGKGWSPEERKSRKPK